MRRLAMSAAVIALTLWGQSASAVELAAHRAEYKLNLDSATGGDVTSGTGTMTYQVQDSCDGGWAVSQRLVMALVNREGQPINMVSDYTTYESKDGLKLTFRMRQTTEDAVTSEVAGTASLTAPGGPGTATYTLPEATTKALPAGTLFPTAHTEAILAAAKAGKTFIGIPLFDGTSPDGAQDSSVVMSKWAAPHASTWAPLATMPSGKFHIAFFDRTAAATTPDYEVTMRYFENGIADDLSMNFGDFVMAGKLDKLVVAKPGCGG